MSNVYDDLVANVEAARDFASLLDELLEAGTLDDLDGDLVETITDHGYELEDWQDDPAGLFHELVAGEFLDLYAVAHISADLIDVREVVAVTGVGGPHIEFAVDYNGRVVARGYWGGDKVERVTTVAHLGEYLADTLGGWEQ